MTGNDQGMTEDQTPMSREGTDRPSTSGFGHSLVIGLWSLVIPLVLSPPVARAHPIPRFEYDRNVTVEWRADAVHITYRVEIDLFTLLLTVGNPDNGFPVPKGQFGPKDAARAYVTRM